MESVPGIREQGFWWERGRAVWVCSFLGMFSPLAALQERRAGSLWGRRKGECCVEGEGIGDSRGTRNLRLGLCHPRKELKDPDQLYTTLKNLLAQIKVGKPGSPLGFPPPVPVLDDPVWSGWQLELGVGHSGPGPSSALLSSVVTPQCLALHGACEEVRGP